jgi:RNA polymerase sigma-70 factor (ECF subfamily)
LIYCVVPRDLARLHEPLREFYSDDPNVEVILERRGRGRRAAVERRAAKVTSLADERRRIRGEGGRRAAERRAPLVPIEETPELPRRARRHAERIVFVQRIEPSSQIEEDADTARVITQIQAGHSDEFETIYLRYFDRVYSYLRVVLGDAHEAEDATQQVFMKVLEALPGYERRSQPFRAWLFVIARNYAIGQVEKLRRTDVVEPEELNRRREPVGREPADPRVVDWISDRELLLFIERLPLPQRQVLMLRYMMDLSNVEIAEILERTANDVAVLHHRALAFMNERLSALGRPTSQGVQPRMRRWAKQAPVLRARRFVLTG